MKKNLLCVIIIALIPVLLFTACAGGNIGKAERENKAVNPALGAFTAFMPDTQELDTIWRYFVSGNKNRRAFTDGESAAANFIKEELLVYGYYADEITEQSYTRTFTVEQATFFNDAKTEERTSQNIVLSIEGKTEQTIIIGASYDNSYSDGSGTTAFGTEQKNDGALDNGSGVAILLALAKGLAAAREDGNIPEYGLELVFFGGSYYGYTGSQEYIRQSNKPAHSFLMLDISRIGGGKTYYYTDEVSTLLGDNLKGKGFSDLPKIVPVLDASATADIPYSHVGLDGNNAVFMSHDITSVKLFGAYFGSLSVLDYEGKQKMMYNDTLERVEREYPNAAEKMQQALSAITDIISDNGYLALVSNSNQEKFDYSLFLKPWIAYIILGSLIALLMIILVLVAKRLEKRYKPAPPKKLKLAVFGLDYETIGDDTIFIVPKNPTDINARSGAGKGNNQGPQDPFSGY